MENFGSRTIAICENGNSLDVSYTWPIKAWILRNPELCPCKFNSSILPSTIVSLYLILCKQHLSRGNKIINIKVAVGLAKRAIIHTITNCYRTIGWQGLAIYLLFYGMDCATLTPFSGICVAKNMDMTLRSFHPALSLSSFFSCNSVGSNAIHLLLSFGTLYFRPSLPPLENDKHEV